jgi:transposase
MDNETAEQLNSNSKPWLFKKGQSGNPSGRKKGWKSLKTYAKEMIERMNDEERQEYLAGLPKSFIWEMAEGKAISKIEGDVNLKVEKLGDIAKATKDILNG